MVDAMLGKQPIEDGADAQFEYLVKWRGPLEPTWTEYADIYLFAPDCMEAYVAEDSIRANYKVMTATTICVCIRNSHI